MEQQVIIGVSIAITLAVLIGIKALLHRVVKFKMDESAILRFFKEASGGEEFHTVETISTGIDVDAGRVSEVCIKSNAMKIHSKENESWCLKH
ncbi:MAG: hypothetical protein V7742_14910 [Halioglobus sp.]